MCGGNDTAAACSIARQLVARCSGQLREEGSTGCGRNGVVMAAGGFRGDVIEGHGHCALLLALVP
jgi:hypothetical protein